MSLTITIPGAVNATTGATAPATLTVGVGIPGAQGPQGPAGAGVPTGGTAGQFLTKIDGTNYNTDWTTVNLSQYLTTSAAAATYQPLSGMSSYLTTSSAASTYAPIAAGQPTSGTVGQVLTKNSGTNYDSSWTTLIPGDRYLTSSTTSLTVGNGTKSLTIGTGLSYSPQQDIVISYDATAHMHAVVTSYDSGTGALVCDVQNHTGSGTFADWTVNVGGTTPLQSVYWGEILGTLGDQSDLATALNAKLETSTAASTYAALSGASFTGEVATPASTTSSAGFSIAPGTAPTTPQNGEMWNTGSDLQVRLGGVTETLAEQSWVTTQLGSYLTTSAAASTYQTLAGMSSYLTTSAASTTYAALAGATFTGLVSTPAATTASAFLRLAHGAAPTTPVNGDVWTTTSGLFARINGGTQQYAPLGSTNTFTGTNTFSGASVSVGTSTAASTINIGTGATLTATTKAINIGTAGVSGSTTNIAIGSAVAGATTTTTISGNITATGLTLDLGNNTATSASYTLGGGATISGATKTVNIGSGGVAGSTTTINIGSTTGTSNVNFNVTTGTVSLGGNATATTSAADTNTTAVATTAYVVGQAGSATPLINGTAAVGTSLRYARQDHVHPTDTTRAALASPTFTGTPAAPTAAADTNTTQLATTAYVVGQASATSPAMDGTATVGTSLKYARADHVHPTDTTRAPLASPTFTGTVTIPAGASISGFAPLASPALTGTPTAPTATAGTNTTQVATTAFVQSALPVMATETQAIYGTSSTTTISPLLMRYILSNPGYQTYNSLVGNYSSYVSGSGSVSTLFSNFAATQITAANGKAAFMPNNNGSYHSIFGRGKSELNVDWSKPLWFAFRFCYSSGAQLGDTNTVNRVTIGKTSSYFGDLTGVGFGVKWTAGTTGAFTVMAHNGSALSTSASAVTISNTTYFPSTTSSADFMVYSDGAGNITLYCNNVQVATTTGGPSSGTTPGPRFVFETDNTTSTTTTVTCDYYGIRSMLAY